VHWAALSRGEQNGREPWGRKRSTKTADAGEGMEKGRNEIRRKARRRVEKRNVRRSEEVQRHMKSRDK